MVQDFTAFRKISFQTVDVEVALAEIEYQYLKFVCEATLRNSDEFAICTLQVYRRLMSGASKKSPL